VSDHALNRLLVGARDRSVMKPTRDTGDYAAEYDEHLLKVWINYYSLPDLLNDKTFRVVGGKGAGKTALAKYLSHTELDGCAQTRTSAICIWQR
jgi:polynucleotide 5'-kinase involved in rRNA processing